MYEKNHVQPPNYLKSAREKNIYIYFVDTNTDFPLWRRAIKIFNDYTLQKTKGGGAEDLLVLALDTADTAAAEVIKKFVFETVPKDKLDAIILQLNVEGDRSLISGADFFIANRDPRSIIRSEFADEYGVKILSAVDTHGF